MNLLWPDAVKLFPTKTQIGSYWTRSFVVVGYPRVVRPGWFEPLLRFPWPLTWSFYTGPLEPVEVMGKMRRRLLWSRGIQDANRSLGHLNNPEQEAAIEDAERIRRGIAEGDTRILEVGVSVTVWAPTIEELENASKLILSLSAGMMLVLRLLRYQQERGIRQIVPLGEVPSYTREMDSQAWATLFPLTAQDLIHPHGQVMGMNPMGQSLVIVDRFKLSSPHSITIGWSGSGKSFAAKIEALRTRFRGISVTILDPEGEYRLLSKVGARVWTVGDPTEPVFPFDPWTISAQATSAEIERQGDFMVRFISRLDPFFASQAGQMVEQAIWRLVKKAVNNGRFPGPGDAVCDPKRLLTTVESIDPVVCERLEAVYHRWAVIGGKHLPEHSLSPFEVFDFSRLTDRFRHAAYLALTELISRRMGRDGKRLVIFDEAWHLLNEPDTAFYLEGLFRRARKWDTALSLLTQDIGDFTRSRSAEVCLRNAPLVLLLRQHPESIGEVETLLRLHQGETDRLKSVSRGQGILLVEEDHLPVRIIASPMEQAVASFVGKSGGEESDSLV